MSRSLENPSLTAAMGRARVHAIPGFFMMLLVLVGLTSFAQVNVYTRSYDLDRTSANLQETVLTPANVNSTGFGKLFTVVTDGQIYAQPLYVANLAIAGGTHNVVFVASMRNTLYALDADDGTQLWTQTFGTPITPQYVQNDQNISWSTGLGILSTPVIDPSTNIIYVVSAFQSTVNGNVVYAYHLNALEIATGLPVSGSPVTMTATYSTADLTTPLVFSPKHQNQRAGLVLANGNIYIAFGSHDDITPYHGWVLAYSASTLAQTAVYADTTIGSEGGIWNAGQAPAVDSAGNLYLTSGNGSFGTTPNNLVQTGNSFIKLSPTLQLLGHFTPNNSAALNSGDMDLGSAGVLLIPNTNYVLGGGKQGVLYLVDTDDMGGFNSSSDQVRQEFQAIYGKGTSHIHGTPAYFNSDVNGPTTYVWGENDVLRAFLYNSTTALVNTTPIATSTMTAPVTNNDGAMPGGFLTVSANGGSNGIVWASTPYNGNAVHQIVQGVLYAFDANTLSLLWSDKTKDARDEIGLFAKYCPPMVANGKVYVPNFGPVGTTDGSGSLVVYGLLQSQLTVNVANAGMTVGGTVPTLTGAVTGLVNGDAVGTTIVVTYSTTATSSSPVGAYPITATVSGSSAGNYTIVVDAGTLTVNPAPTTTTLNAPAGAAFGASVTLTATVTSTAGTPAGSVTFANGATFLGSATLNGSGVATLSTSALPGGTASVTASYTAAGNFAASTSAASTITISQATQTISFPAIASRGYGSASFAVTATSSAGTNYPVAIAVQSGPATIAAGTLTLTGAGAVVLQASQAGGTDYSPATATQTFQVTPAVLTVAANNVSRTFGASNPAFTGTLTGAVGSDSFSESFSTTATVGSNTGSYPIVPSVSGGNLASYTVNLTDGTLTVTSAATTTTLGVPASAAYGASVTLTATVTSIAGTPAGNVTFNNGATVLGTGTLNGSGVATLTTSALPTGTVNVTVTYGAAGNFATSTSTVSTITINQATQAITFAAIASRAYGSAPFAVTATSSAGNNYPVSIKVQSGPAAIGSGLVTLTGVGTVVLQASQPGDANYSAATTTQSFQVTPAVLTVAANNASRSFGVANPAFSGIVTGAVDSDSFSESFTTTATAGSNVGSYAIVPSLGGADPANYTVNLSNGVLTVTPAATTTALNAPGSAAYGTSITLTATVSSTAGTPAGTVTFYDGPNPLGSGTLNGSGTATLSTSTLPAGSDTVTALYAPAANFAGSVSTASTVTVNGGSQTITFPPIASRAYGSAPFAVSGSSSLGAGYPVTITVQSGPAVMAGGIVSLTGVGTVVLQATQPGNAQYSAATTTQSFQVTPAATATTLSAPATATYGLGVSLTATVTSTAGTPAGIVTFYNGSTALGNGTLSGSGVATLNTAALPVGTDTVTAAYASAGNFALSTSPAATIIVGAAPIVALGSFTLNASPTSLSIQSGSAANTTLSILPTGGYSGTVAFSCSNPPSGISCAFGQNQVTLSGNNQTVNVSLTIQMTAQQAANRANPTLLALAFWWPGGITGLAIFARKRKQVRTRLFANPCLLLLCTVAFAAGLSGCGTSGSTMDQGAATTTQLTVVAAGTVSQTLVLTVNKTP